MSEPLKEYEVELGGIVTAPSKEDAVAALERSGIYVGTLIGEVLIEHTEILTDD